MGFADIVLHQYYENNSANPLETLFMMPYSDSFALNKIILEFTLADGTKKSLETQVSEREKAKITYSQAISDGDTAIMSYTESPVE